MNDFDQSFLEFQATDQVRRSAENWLAAFEKTLASRDVAPWVRWNAGMKSDL